MLSPDQQQELLDSVVEDFTLRLRSGERPAISEYKEKYPSVAEDIEELLTSVAMIEELKTQNPPTQSTLKREMKEILKLDRIGDYRIIRELGRGGMGIVFEAEHDSLGRRVAIKVMPNRTFDDEKYLERFRREAQAAANLHHTNIVSVFGIGQTGEHHYYVMEYVDGESLSSILSRLNQLNESLTHDGKNIETIVDKGVDPIVQDDSRIEVGIPAVKPTAALFNSSRERVRWAARLGAQIADGLAYAHALGTLHRDIKPSNLLVDKNETIWLTDFGLVKNLSNQTITKTGDIIGTPQYMAPESFEGTYDERSETYCLGLTLYEMATLKPAFENASTPELIRKITTTSPLPPRKLDRKIPRDLERIILKAISREPGYRYQTALDLREDLRAFLDDRPIAARQISMAENLWRWSRRNPFPAAMSILTGLMICLIAIAATVALAINNRALVESEENKKRLEVEFRRADFNRRKAEESTRFAVESYDRMFRAKILDDGGVGDDISLDGFMDLEGISASIDESDAEFLASMLDFYAQFAEKHTNALDLKEISASSQRRVANIYHLLGQFDDAIKSYDDAITIYEEIHWTNPRSIPTAISLVKTIKEKARALELNVDPKNRSAVEAEYDKAIKILREHRHAEKEILQIELAKTLLAKCFPPIDLPHRLPDRFAELRKGSPGLLMRNQRGYFWLIQAYRNLSRNNLSVRDKQQINDSEQAITECLDIADELLAKNWKKHDVLFIKAVSLARLSIILRGKNKRSQAQECLKKSTDLLTQLVNDHPSNAEYQFALAENYSIPRLSRASEVQSLESAKRIMQSLVERYERNIEYQQFLANLCVRLGIIYNKSEKQELAEANLNLAYTTYRPLLPITPRNRAIQISGFKSTLNYVDILMENDKPGEATTVLQESIDDLEQMRDNQGFRMIRQQYVLKKIGLYNALSLVFKETGRYTEAIEAKQKALYLLEQAPGRKRMRNVGATNRRKPQ